jgi:anti-sigma B factor antagonist
VKLADVHFSNHERVVIARLTGEVDLSNAISIEVAVAEATPNHALALILDVSAVDYMDSAGIHLVYRLREKLKARGQGLRLVIPAHSPASDALRLAGVSRNIETSETVHAALSEFAPADASAEVPDQESV